MDILNMYRKGFYSKGRGGPETYNYGSAEEGGGEYPLSVKNSIFRAANSKISMSTIKAEA
jgi:hypothetical protein